MEVDESNLKVNLANEVPLYVLNRLELIVNNIKTDFKIKNLTQVSFTSTSKVDTLHFEYKNR